MRGVDAVIHLAGQSAWDDIVRDDRAGHLDEVITGGTRNVAHTARQTGARMVYISSTVVLGGTRAPTALDEKGPADEAAASRLAYARAKRCAEAVCHEAVGRGADIVTVNPAEVYGPGDTAFITSKNLIYFAESSPVVVCRGGTSIAYVDDVAAAIVGALDRGRTGHRYFLGGSGLTLVQLARMCLDIIGKRTRIITVPGIALAAFARLSQLLHLPGAIDPGIVPYATRYWFIDSTKARRELGARFRSARDTLTPTLTWLREAGHIA